MATIKTYTDIEQSKKLAEILPFESADLFYVYDRHLDKHYGDTPYVINYKVLDKNVAIPCWSLAALLSVLPNNEHITTSVSRGSWEIEPINYLPNTWWCEYEDSKSLTEFNVSADNPIDACYKMIIKLNELNLL